MPAVAAAASWIVLRDSTADRGAAAALRRSAAESGYLFFRGLIAADRILDLRRQIVAICREFGWLDERAAAMEGRARRGALVGDLADPKWAPFQCRVLTLPAFRQLRDHEAIGSVLAALYRGPVRSEMGDTCRVFSPRSHELTTPPHQDHHYVRGSTDLWTVWIPLGACPRNLGGLAILPGTHRHGLRPHAGCSGEVGISVAPEETWATADYRCGDVLLFNTLTIHRALENRTTRQLRVSVDFRYAPAERA